MNKKFIFLCIVVIILTSLVIIGTTSISAAQENYKFDFGNQGTISGYIGVSATTSYSKTIGYGFNTPQNMKNVTAAGMGVESDAVQFLTYGTKSNNTFNVDLPNGLYEVSVTLGNTSRASIAAEGVFQIINMTGNNAKDKFQIPITDGQLNLLVTEGKSGTAFTLSALEINRISQEAITNKTIYIGGDSTVCNYYPLDTSVQAGWGQLLNNYVDTKTYQVRNMASGGQIARGFKDDGQFEAILKYLKSGDYFILQFGINDTNEKNSTTESQFKEIMGEMVTQAKAKGATVVLSTPQGRSTDFNSSNIHSSVNRWYRNATLALVKETNVVLVDLNVLSSAYFTLIGKDATAALYMSGDTLHLNRSGAKELARIFAEDLKKQGYLKADNTEKTSQLTSNSINTSNPSNPIEKTTSAVITTTPQTSSVITKNISFSYEITNDWGSGANCSITIKNNGTSAINGWTIGWTFSGNQKITNMWNGKYTQNGTNVIVTNEAWNANIVPNGNTTIGFGLVYSGTNNKPTSIYLK